MISERDLASKVATQSLPDWTVVTGELPQLLESFFSA